MSSMTVNMIGLGYIGLPTAAVMALKGMNVIGTDINKNACELINDGKIHIVEPGLQKLVSSVVSAGLLKAQTVPAESADVFVIAVPTPFRDGYSPNLDYIEAAVKSLAPSLKKGDLVILESTSPVGTTEKLSQWLAEHRPDLAFPVFEDKNDGADIDVNVAYCPERVLPGQVIRELRENDRVVGGITEACSEKAKAFYANFVDGECCTTNARTAEMTKLTENSFRDVNIAFANELSTICDELQINVWELISMANRHPRVNILQPGCGVGGHCIAVDPWFIVDKSPERARLIKMAREVNDGKPIFVAQKLSEMLFAYLNKNPSASMSSVKVACYGMAFKPNIDDMRESPAVDAIKAICRAHKGITLNVVEPHLEGDLPPALSQENIVISTLEESMDADIKVVLVAHDYFKRVDELNVSSDSVLNVAWPTK